MPRVHERNPFGHPSLRLSRVQQPRGSPAGPVGPLWGEGSVETASAVRYEISAAQDDVQEQRRRTQERMLRLDDQRTKLLQAHCAGAVALDLLKKEQDRIADEMRAAEAALARTEYTAEQIEATINNAGEARQQLLRGRRREHPPSDQSSPVQADPCYRGRRGRMGARRSNHHAHLRPRSSRPGQ